MMKEILNQTKHSVLFVAAFTVLCGLVYPGVTTLLGKTLFPRQAGGSLIEVSGKKVGSELIGQPFDDPRYFWSRPSATGPFAYNASNSSGSNLGPTNQAQLDAVKGRIDALKKANPEMADKPVPMDLVTASGSGLDPHISLAAAEYQVPRISKVRNLSVNQIEGLIQQNTQGRWLGFIGDPGVNVLKLNLDLDGR